MSLSGEIGRRLAALIVLQLLALIFLACSARPAVAEVGYEMAPSPFCDGEVVHDFLKPLGGLPALHGPPKSEELPFGPHSLRLGATDELAIGGGEIGFSVAAHQRRSLHLRWSVETTLVRISAGGRQIGKPQSSRRRLRVLRPFLGIPLGFEVPGKPAIYRVTVVLMRASGRRLARFGSYFRVVRGRVGGLRLETNAPAYRHESTVFARVANYGTLLASYGVPYAVERFDGGAWTTATESPKGPWIRPLLGSGPGRSGRCNAFWIPPSMAPGRYRVVKRVNLSPTFLELPGKRRTLTAEFEVLPPDPGPPVRG